MIVSKNKKKGRSDEIGVGNNGKCQRVGSGQNSDTQYFLKAFVPRCSLWNIMERAGDNC
jgi:hypothetical protein